MVGYFSRRWKEWDEYSVNLFTLKRKVKYLEEIQLPVNGIWLFFIEQSSGMGRHLRFSSSHVKNNCFIPAATCAEFYSTVACS
jgi:hypothetical protein